MPVNEFYEFYVKRQAGSGKTRFQQNCSPRKQKCTVPLKPSKKRRFNGSPEAQTSEILCKPTKEQNHRLTGGLSPVFITSSFPDMPCMKRVYMDKNASFHWSAARNKARFSFR